MIKQTIIQIISKILVIFIIISIVDNFIITCYKLVMLRKSIRQRR